jgi:hypothetical protein
MIGTSFGHHDILGKRGEGGPPALNAAFGRRFGEIPPQPR